MSFTSSMSPSVLRCPPRLRALALAAVGIVAFLVPPAAQAEQPPAAAELTEQVIYSAADEDGYACFRIPAIVETNSGTLLAFAEGRVNDCLDAGDIDLVVKRSIDGGATWGPLEVVAEGGGDTRGNPAPVVDAETGRILLASTHNPGVNDGTNCDIPCERTPYLQYSDDDGVTWSDPASLSEELLPAEWNSWYATGPVHGIQLTQGANAGRLLFTINAESYADGRVTENHAALAYSDDGGDTWQLGATDTWPIAADGTFGQKPSEMSLLERSDGSIYVNGREEGGMDLGHRTAAVSSDGGESFDAPFAAIPDLYTPTVQGSVLRLESGRTLFACPADPDRRRTMVIRSSWDEGATWDSVDRAMPVTTDWAGYSDMVELPDGAGIGLMYEGGAVDARDEIRFATFTEDDLGPQAGPDPTTPDGAAGAEPASVLGGAAAGEGQFEGGVTFDGTDDAVRLPYRDSLLLGDGDFTISLWFRYSATTGTQPFLWMGGVGGAAPQVWVRGEPDDGRIRGLITAIEGGEDAVSASVSTSEAFNDGAWHHLAMTRGGGQIYLAIDGGELLSTPDIAGSVSVRSVFGVHAGQGVDSRSHLTGSLDEVRVYDRAMTADELTEIRETNAIPADEPVLHLPMDEVNAP
jgi:sialidase-1